MRVVISLSLLLFFVACSDQKSAPKADAIWPDTSALDAGGDLAHIADLKPDLAAWLGGARCHQQPPAGVSLAPPLPSYEGICPAITSGRNTLVTSGRERQFIVITPSEIQPGERLPVIFLWHWLAGEAQDFVDIGELEQATDQLRFIAVAPESLHDLVFYETIDVPWPFLEQVSKERYEEEYRFFDDMLACVGEAFPVDKECVSTLGISAGALFTVHLASARSERLASVVSLSGGTRAMGPVVSALKIYESATRKLPAMVLWGGPSDVCILLNFQKSSQAYEERLEEDGHFFLECVHGCQHAVPPLDPPQDRSLFHQLWRFSLDHPFWLPAGQSPYLVDGLPSDGLSWCGIGKGSSTPPPSDSCPLPGCPG